MTEADCIIQRLNQMARFLYYRGYGIPALIFSDLSCVSTTDWAPDPLTEVETLLQQGERPLGFIAALRDRRVEPFVEPWQSGGLAALVKLNDMARLRYHHRMLSESEYQENSNNGDSQKTRKTQ
ncbi:MAG: hypothetical protein WAK29_12915 [Terriglobales bacterium]